MVKISLELSVFIHSTEDDEKVLQTLLNVVPANLRQVLAQHLRTQILEGYYGNIIKQVKLSISKNVATEVLKHILCSLSKVDRDILLTTLESRVEERRARLHFRLSKQDLHLGKYVLSEGSDVVKVVASFEGVRYKELGAVLRDIGGSCDS
ncbi:MAG: RNA-binding domain-containing protein [Sulfolobales archaeon]|nr:hypothetical protein [Sulfolobales archaeon]MDW8082999.1 RNA-binding domain-containing protein [Sulfolobales archaeon]